MSQEDKAREALDKINNSANAGEALKIVTELKNTDPDAYEILRELED